ncbi:MAG: AEC family transporter [Clostridia bacterium]|nr:AEC family transporter [Clostridia bacterium]
MLDISQLIVNLFSLFIIMVIGFVLVKCKAVPAETSKGLSAVLMNVALPAMLVYSMVSREFDAEFIRDGLIIIGLGFAEFFLFGVLSFVFARVFKVPVPRRGSWMFASTFSNNGFMGFPIVLAVLGAPGLALAVMLNIPQNICVYALGPFQIRLGSGKGGNGTGVKGVLKSLCTVINFSIVLGILLYFLRIPVPEFVQKPLLYLNNLTTALPMLIIGMNLGAADLKSTFTDHDALTNALTRLILFPVILWALLKLIPVNNVLIKKVLLLIYAMPTAAVAAPLSMANEGDPMLASRTTFFSTVACLVTIPLICLLP